MIDVISREFVRNFLVCLCMHWIDFVANRFCQKPLEFKVIILLCLEMDSSIHFVGMRLSRSVFSLFEFGVSTGMWDVIWWLLILNIWINLTINYLALILWSWNPNFWFQSIPIFVFCCMLHGKGREACVPFVVSVPNTKH